MDEQKKRVVYAGFGDIKQIEVPLPDAGGAVAVLHIKRIDSKVRAKWAAAQRKHAQDELRRVAQLRKQYSREEWPELYERDQLDAEGKPVFYEAEDLFDKEGNKAKIPLRLKPVDTHEATESEIELGRMVVSDTLVKIEGPSFGDVDAASLTKPAELLDALDMMGIHREAVRLGMELQKPRAKQLL